MKNIIFLISILIPNVAMSLETAPYKVVKDISDKIQIREYEEIILATISNKKDSQNSNFRALFKFIAGENEKGQEIKMTTPVFQKNSQSSETMSFVMPATFNKENLPKPNNKNIIIEILENTSFIAIRFSGRASDRNFAKHQEILKTKSKEMGIRIDAQSPINAYYNRPWTLPFLKRNEVLFRVL